MFARDNLTNSTVGFIVEEPFGVVVNFNVQLNVAKTRHIGGGLLLHLDVTRSGALKAFVVIAAIANWLVTVAFLWITVATFIWKEKVAKELFAIPIATLFAFTSVRANMPGAPSGFGCLVDYASILPNLAVITLCSAILLILVLLERVFDLHEGSRQEYIIEPEAQFQAAVSYRLYPASS